MTLKVFVTIYAVLACHGGAYAQNDVPASEQNASARERQLLDRIQKLEERLAAVEGKLATQVKVQADPAPVLAAAPAVPQPVQRSATGDSTSLTGFAAGTTLNFLFDGYYEYSFNRPVGRVNLLRPYDATSNTFTPNQAVVMVERTPDLSLGRRFGLRLDLMFGQSTESLSANPANEPRTIPYPNIFQAYGTYVVPLGKGVNVDFGRFVSSLGLEGTYAKDQINYTRSMLFTALPFYHTGFRTAYKLSDKASFSWLLVNGINQTEDFNGLKSNQFTLSTTPAKNVSWTASYYFGEENRDVTPLPPSNLPPPLPTQPGLSTNSILPRPNGRTHIADSYLTLNITPKITLVGEGDYIISRLYANSSPVHVAGGAGYARFQVSPALSVAGRFEYVSDRGGFLSGATQALKEGTLTATWQPVDGFQMKAEFRHDYSNQPFFLTSVSGVLRKTQNTALVGLLWWFGGKQGSW